MKKIAGWAVALAGVALVAACGGGSGGGSSSPQSLPPGFYVTIRNMTFDPAELAVPPGATVTVMNEDGFPHSATSEAAPNDFTPGAAGGVSFDTGPFTGTHTFTIPSTGLTDGTVVPYYCSVHKGAMTPPNPTIRIDSTAKPSVPTGTTGTTGGTGGTSGGGGMTGGTGTAGGGY